MNTSVFYAGCLGSALEIRRSDVWEELLLRNQLMWLRQLVRTPPWGDVWSMSVWEETDPLAW